MIISIILYLIYAFIWTVLLPIRALPDVSLPSGITNAISQASTYLSMIDVIIPIITLLAVLIAVIAVDAIIMTYKIVMWVIRKIPGIG